MTKASAPPPLSGRRLVAATFAALALALLVVLGFVAPAEYGRDPLGVGRLTGVARLWAPEDQTIEARSGAGPLAREFDQPFRSDVVEIPLGGFLSGAENSELEYKVRMRKGAVLTYAWEVVGAQDGRDFRFDQHGHTTPKAGQAMQVVTFRQGSSLQQRGAITAPFDGIQGWQFSNAGDDPVVVRLRLAGFYDLVPAGQPGNEAGVLANVPAARARPHAPKALRSAP
ncbi:hypothetical protein [Phenylobacterium sp.]|uniref:hypothetical protein n=1 Tax=Phenylobacterium sp. TaxID=1871053 RepID=UPI0028116B6D|nr:hypothetical protein [Phenylobacterium sp.]